MVHLAKVILIMNSGLVLIFFTLSYNLLCIQAANNVDYKNQFEQWMNAEKEDNYNGSPNDDQITPIAIPQNAVDAAAFKAAAKGYASSAKGKATAFSSKAAAFASKGRKYASSMKAKAAKTRETVGSIKAKVHETSSKKASGVDIFTPKDSRIPSRIPGSLPGSKAPPASKKSTDVKPKDTTAKKISTPAGVKHREVEESGPIHWVTCTDGQLPDGAVEGGKDDDGELLFVCRANHARGKIPGKFKFDTGKATGRAYIPWGCAEHEYVKFEVLTVVNPGLLEWIPASGGQTPPTAIVGGPNEIGETLYIGRWQKNGNQVIGKIHPSHKCCYIAYDGKELQSPDYEVLTLRRCESQ